MHQYFFKFRFFCIYAICLLSLAEQVVVIPFPFLITTLIFLGYSYRCDFQSQQGAKKCLHLNTELPLIVLIVTIELYKIGYKVAHIYLINSFQWCIQFTYSTTFGQPKVFLNPKLKV